MSVSMFYLTGVPAEIPEKIFICLPGQEIIEMEAVRTVAVTSMQPYTDSFTT